MYFSPRSKDPRTMEELTTTRSAASRLMRSYLIFVVLVSGLLLTAFTLNRGLQNLYSRTAGENVMWNEDQRRIDLLQELALLSDAPSDDVFVSGDITGQEDRQKEAAMAFERKLRETESFLSEHLRRTDSPDAASMARLIASLREDMAKMTLLSTELSSQLRAGNRELAEITNVEIERTDRALQGHLTALREQIRKIRQLRIDEQTRSTKRVNVQGKLLGLCFLVLIASLLLYGFQLGRNIVGIDVLAQSVDRLKVSEERFQLASRATSDVIWEWNLSSDCMWFSEAAAKLYSVDLPASGWLDRQKALAWVHPEDVGSMMASVQTAIEGIGDSWKAAYRILRTDGTIAHVIGRAQIVRRPDGRAARLIGAVSDVTARKQAVEALRKSEERFQLVARATSDVFWDWDLGTGRFWINDPCPELNRPPLGNISVVDDVFALIHWEDRDRVVESLSLAVKQGESWREDYRIRDHNGRFLNVYARGCPVTDTNGTTVRMVGVVVDITERVRAAEILRQSEERFQLIAGATNSILWDWDQVTQKVWVNDTFLESYGHQAVDNMISEEELAKHRHPDDAARVRAGLRTALLGTDDFWSAEYRIRRKDGTWAESHNRANIIRAEDGTAVRMFGVMTDVSEQAKALRAARDAEERFRLVAMATTDRMWDWNLITNRCWINDTFVREYGLNAPDNVIAIEDWAALIHPDEVQRVVEGIHQVIDTGGQFWAEEYRIRQADGSWGDVNDRGYVVHDEAGTPVRMLGAMADVTDRKRAERSLESSNHELFQLNRRTQLILDSAADAIVGFGVDRAIIFANPAAGEVLGVPSALLLGKQLDPRIQASVFSNAGNSRGAVTLETTFFRHDGSPFPAEYLLGKKLDEHEEITGFVLTFRDVTQRHAVEKLKSEFVSVVSHELRTPLTSIRGALGLLEGGMLGALTDRGRRMLEIAISNADRLVRLINDILDIERMESSVATLNPTDCDAADLISQAIDVMRPMAEKAEVLLVDESEAVMIRADSDRILQTLTNLLSNAIKFSPPHSTVRVSVTAGPDDRTVIHVRDEGRGIPTENLEAVFERFHQVDASDSREKGGSGLGLAICRSIIRQHGGEMGVTSIVGQGSDFHFSIPRLSSSEPEASRTPVSSPAPEATRRRLLVCDDDESTLQIIREMLSPHGFEVVTVTSAIELLERVETFRPHAILLDVFMPFMDGWQTMAALRANPATAEIPILFVTVAGRGELTAHRDVPEGWLQKPVEEASLIEALQGVLGMEDRRPRVVLVEDDLDLAGVVMESFERQGIQTFHAANGRKALELFDQMVPDLVILDVVLPELDGYAVVAHLREKKEFRHVPVVVYSADELTALDRSRLKLGPTEFLTKSRISPHEFEARVIGMLSRITDQPGKDERHVA